MKTASAGIAWQQRENIAASEAASAIWRQLAARQRQHREHGSRRCLHGVSRWLSYHGGGGESEMRLASAASAGGWQSSGAGYRLAGERQPSKK
jgi:hypothetical protein